MAKPKFFSGKIFPPLKKIFPLSKKISPEIRYVCAEQQTMCKVLFAEYLDMNCNKKG